MSGCVDLATHVWQDGRRSGDIAGNVPSKPASLLAAAVKADAWKLWSLAASPMVKACGKARCSPLKLQMAGFLQRLLVALIRG